MAAKKWTFDRLIRIIIYLGGIFIIFYLIHSLSHFLLPFFLALFVAYLLDPIVSGFKKGLKLKKRGLAVLLTFVFLFVVIFLIYRMISPMVAQEFANVKTLLQENFANLKYQDVIPKFIRTPLIKFLQSDIIKDYITQENISKYGTKVLSEAWHVILGTTNILLSLIGIITFFLYLVFIMLFYDYFRDNWQKVIPPMYREEGVMLFTDIEKEMKVYFRGQAKIVLTVSILFAIGFRIIDLPLGIVLGIFVGLLNFIPYMQTLGVIPALMLAGLKSMETGTSFGINVLLTLAVFVAVQAIQEVFLNPKILGDATGLNPAIILLALSVWGGLLGIIGMILALPMTSLIFSYYRIFILKEGKRNNGHYHYY